MAKAAAKKLPTLEQLPKIEFALGLNCLGTDITNDPGRWYFLPMKQDELPSLLQRHINSETLVARVLESEKAGRAKFGYRRGKPPAIGWTQWDAFVKKAIGVKPKKSKARGKDFDCEVAVAELDAMKTPGITKSNSIYVVNGHAVTVFFDPPIVKRKAEKEPLEEEDDEHEEEEEFE